MPRAEHGRCYNCHQVGHLSSDCPEPYQTLCYNCNQVGHKAPTCSLLIRCRRCGKFGHKERECSEPPPSAVCSTERPITIDDEDHRTTEASLAAIDDDAAGIGDCSSTDAATELTFRRWTGSVGPGTTRTLSVACTEPGANSAPSAGDRRGGDARPRTRPHRRRTVESLGVRWAVADEDNNSSDSPETTRPSAHSFSAMESSVMMRDNHQPPSSLKSSHLTENYSSIRQANSTMSSGQSSHYEPSQRPRTSVGYSGRRLWDDESDSAHAFSTSARRSAGGRSCGGQPFASTQMVVAAGHPKDHAIFPSTVAGEPNHLRNASIRSFRATVHVNGKPMWLAHPVVLQQDPGAYLMY